MILIVTSKDHSVYCYSMCLKRNSPDEQVFAAGLLANTSLPVNHTQMPALLGAAGKEHARFHIQSPEKAQ